MITTISTDHGAPVIAGARLRAGKANSGKGAARTPQHGRWPSNGSPPGWWPSPMASTAPTSAPSATH
ncbi:hypothetical protein A5741_10270 [Mycolicibacterium conceptionense]|nr:hypothetical protein A5639_02935 [Mycolicibacterium conceptionense]OMB68155.1 hypothetical protein A5741_10270 [Mycolicibacterium conceptionense]